MPPHDTLAEPVADRSAPENAPESAGAARAPDPAPPRPPAPEPRRRSRPGRTRTDRFEVCTDCAALVRGEAPTDDAVDLREIERGLARLTAPIGRRGTLRDAGESAGHRNAPCACCRRPLPGARVVIERTLRAGLEPDEPD